MTDPNAAATSGSSAVPNSAAAPSLDWPKELVSSALAAAIIAFTLYFLFEMFSASPDVSDKVWQHQSSILQVCVALAGTVTGYYFGRIPAERAATSAQQAAQSANQSLVSNAALADRSSRDAERIRSQVRDLQSQVSNNTSPLGGGGLSQDAQSLRVQISDRLGQILRG